MPSLTSYLALFTVFAATATLADDVDGHGLSNDVGGDDWKYPGTPTIGTGPSMTDDDPRSYASGRHWQVNAGCYESVDHGYFLECRGACACGLRDCSECEFSWLDMMHGRTIFNAKGEETNGRYNVPPERWHDDEEWHEGEKRALSPFLDSEVFAHATEEAMRGRKYATEAERAAWYNELEVANTRAHPQYGAARNLTAELAIAHERVDAYAAGHPVMNDTQLLEDSRRAGQRIDYFQAYDETSHRLEKVQDTIRGLRWERQMQMRDMRFTEEGIKSIARWANFEEKTLEKIRDVEARVMVLFDGREGCDGLVHREENGDEVKQEQGREDIKKMEEEKAGKARHRGPPHYA